MDSIIVRADSSHLEALTSLFTGYRVFYEQEPDPVAERAFLEERFRLLDSVIFLALADDGAQTAAGFVQLYASFDSVDLSPVWILHDLYVAEDERRHGTGRMLMNAARDFCRATDATRVDLSTAQTNKKAQTLYESLGYERDDEFFHYSLAL
jgi:ribosomal protein S18 acetylase RimI-like enzyme